MAVATFLDVDGIQGESRVEGFEDQVEVLSWDWGVLTSGGGRPGSGAGASAGRAEVRALAFVHQVDAASTGLLQACVRGSHVRRAVLRVVALGERPRTVLTVTLEDVTVTSVGLAGAGEGTVESVTLSGRGFEVRYVEQAADGSAGTPHEVAWDGARRA